MTTLSTLEQFESYSNEKPVASTVFDSEQLGAKLICFNPGQSLAPHHTEAVAFFLVHRGSGQISIGDEVFQVSEGEIVPAPPLVDHGITNTGSTALVLLLVQSPNPFFCC